MLKNLLTIGLFLILGCMTSGNETLQNGDIIFHTSRSNQSKVIQKATNSPWSHMGILYKNEGKWFVYEAVQPVKSTPLQKWIDRGEKSGYVVKRLKNADTKLTPAVLKEMKAIGEKYRGKSYDTKFEWSDSKMYCSELVWKIYKEALGVELGKLQSYDDSEVKALMNSPLMQKRYGGKGPAKDAVGISPRAIFECRELETVVDRM